MPRLDGTGPNGEGAKTGRGLGNCDVNGQEENRTSNVSNRPLNQRLFRGLGRRLNGRNSRNRGR